MVFQKRSAGRVHLLPSSCMKKPLLSGDSWKCREPAESRTVSAPLEKNTRHGTFPCGTKEKERWFTFRARGKRRYLKGLKTIGKCGSRWALSLIQGLSAFSRPGRARSSVFFEDYF